MSLHIEKATLKWASVMKNRVERRFISYFEGLVGDNPVEVRIFSAALCVFHAKTLYDLRFDYLPMVGNATRFISNKSGNYRFCAERENRECEDHQEHCLGVIIRAGFLFFKRRRC